MPVGAAEGQFPGYRTIESGDFEEERRLFAVTRAKNELYISYPRVASRPGPGGMMLQPSRFLTELDASPQRRGPHQTQLRLVMP